MLSNKSLQSKIKFIADIKYKIHQDLSSSFEICGWKSDGHLTLCEAFLILYTAHRRLQNRHCDSLETEQECCHWSTPSQWPYSGTQQPYDE
jgi:hypothetical protein